MTIRLIAATMICSALAVGAAPTRSHGSLEAVVRLYKDFAWEAVLGDPQPSEQYLIDQPRAVLEKYFDPSLAELIVRDRSCVEKTREICNLDFAPLWDSQDPSAMDLQVVVGSKPMTVVVTYRYPPSGRVVRLVYRTSKTTSGWRISDIHYAAGHTLAGVLKGKK